LQALLQHFATRYPAVWVALNIGNRNVDLVAQVCPQRGAQLEVLPELQGCGKRLHFLPARPALVEQ
jgi:hypothetical protein